MGRRSIIDILDNYPWEHKPGFIYDILAFLWAFGACVILTAAFSVVIVIAAFILHMIGGR